MNNTITKNWRMLVQHCFRPGSHAFAPGFSEVKGVVIMFERAKLARASNKKILSAIKRFMRVNGASKKQIENEADAALTLLAHLNKMNHICAPNGAGRPPSLATVPCAVEELTGRV